MSICSSAWSRVVFGCRTVCANGIEVDDDDVDQLDALLGQLGEVIGLVAPRQEGGEDLGVERLDAAAQDLVRLGQLGDGPNALDAGFGEVSAGAIGGKELGAGIGQAFGELDDAFTIADGEQGAQSTSSWCGRSASGMPIIGRDRLRGR